MLLAAMKPVPVMLAVAALPAVLPGSLALSTRVEPVLVPSTFRFMSLFRMMEWPASSSSLWVVVVSTASVTVMSCTACSKTSVLPVVSALTMVDGAIMAFAGVSPKATLVLVSLAPVVAIVIFVGSSSQVPASPFPAAAVTVALSATPR